MKPFEQLTPDQAATLPGVRDEWLGYGLSCEPANRALAEEGVREAYAAAGLEPPKIIVWLDSPMAGALGQAYLRSMPIPDRGQVWGQVWDQVRGQVWDQVRDQVRGQVRDQVRGQVWGQVWGQVSDQVSDQVRDQVRDQVSDQVSGQVSDQVSDQVRDQVWGQVSDQVWGQVSDQVWGQVSDHVSDQVRDQVSDQVSDQVRDQVSDQVSDQVWGQVRGQVWGQVRGQVSDQVSDQVRGQVSDQVRDQVSDQVSDQVWGQVWGQVSGQVWGQVRGQVWDQVRGQVSGQVRDQVRGQVRDQVRGQVRGQVSGQVRDQVSGQVSDQVRDQVSGQVWENLNSWSRACIWGQHDVGYLAFTAAMQKIGVPKLDAITGLQKVAQNAGWWWAFKGAVVLTDRPAELHRDKDFRLHSEDGPAIRYRDGFGMYLWHGTRVPADLIETGWTTERIFQEKNTEVRRCAIERLGWPEFIESSGMTRVGEPVPDPGNAPHEIALYDLPKNLADMYDEKARILLATNGSPERDGSIHKFGLVVPGHHTDPVAAAADLFGWPRAAYAALEVRR